MSLEYCKRKTDGECRMVLSGEHNDEAMDDGEKSGRISAVVKTLQETVLQFYWLVKPTTVKAEPVFVALSGDSGLRCNVPGETYATDPTSHL